MAGDHVAEHRKAAERHEVAAETHDRAARFWDRNSDRERAELQRAMAEYERYGAKLERRWAELVDPNGVRSTLGANEHVKGHTREGAKRASTILMQMADTLERTAGLADEHAKRHERAGSADQAAEEHAAGDRAREAARRARSQAQAWLELLEEGEPGYQ